MPFNGPINGDYSNCDWNEAPWVDKIMVFNHEECLFIIGRIEEAEAAYNPEDNNGSEITESGIFSDYNNSDWTYAISWSTFTTLRMYVPEFNTQGINELGIIPEIEVPEEPETPEEPPIEEGTTEVVNEEEAPIEEETTTETPAE